MNYHKLYCNLINSRKKKPTKSDYYENHHINPRSLGGEDKEWNIVKMTPREHYLAHYLLTKCFNEGTQEYIKMLHAFSMMQNNPTDNHNRKINSILYEKLKIQRSKYLSKEISKLKWINKNGKRKRVPENKVDDYIKDGWKLGQKHGNNIDKFIWIFLDGKYLKIKEKDLKNYSNYEIKKPTKEELNKITSEFQKTLITITNGKLEKRINPNDLPEWEYQGWCKGRKDGVGEKLSKSQIGKTQSEKTREKLRQYTGEKTSGWNTKWINNGIINKRININEIDNYLNDGWELGRKNEF